MYREANKNRKKRNGEPAKIVINELANEITQEKQRFLMMFKSLLRRYS